MNAQELVKILDVQIVNIMNAEQEVLKLEDHRRELLLQLQIAEADLLTREGGPINGKNAEIRAAQLLQETAPERVQINEFEREIARRKCELTYHQNVFKINHSLMGLFASRPDLTLIER